MIPWKRKKKSYHQASAPLGQHKSASQGSANAGGSTSGGVPDQKQPTKTSSRKSLFARTSPQTDSPARAASSPSSSRPPAPPPQPCPICQDPVGRPNPDGVTEGWSRLPCGHRFGSRCIKQWMGMCAPGDKPVCPVCRRQVMHACGHPALPVVLGVAVEGEGDWEGDGGGKKGRRKRGNGIGGGGRREKRGEDGVAAASVTVSPQESPPSCDDGRRTSARAGPTLIQVADSLCAYCQEVIVRWHTSKRLRFKREVKVWTRIMMLECYILYRRARGRRVNRNRFRNPRSLEEDPPLGRPKPGEPEPEWEKWWNRQEPVGV